MMQDLLSASDWLKQISQVAQHDQYIRSTTQIWVVMRHQYGISALVSQMSNQWWRHEMSPVFSG